MSGIAEAAEIVNILFIQDKIFLPKLNSSTSLSSAYPRRSRPDLRHIQLQDFYLG